MRKILPYILSILSFQMHSQTENKRNTLSFKELNNGIRLNYILVEMPTDQVSYDLAPKMSLMGLHYNIPITKGLYAGAGMHAAITGDQGGLFTLGILLGTNLKIYKNLFFDANVHFGGGGGYRTLVNGGGMLYPNLGLQYKKKDFSFGIQFGRVNFFTGLIDNDNISFFIEIPSTLVYENYSEAQKKFVLNTNVTDADFKKPAVKSVQQVTFNFLHPVGNSKKDATQNFEPIDKQLSILGFEYQRYLSENTFAYVYTGAMYKGLVAGFMDLFFGVGKSFNPTKSTNLFGKVGIGAAGGRIYPENGLTFYPNVGADIKIGDTFGLGMHAGYYRSIGGSFEAYAVGASLKYHDLSGGTIDPSTKKRASHIKTKGVQVGVQNQTYYNVAKFGIPNSDLQMIALKIFYDISSRWYVAGEGSFAYEGRSGGYAHGMFGFGAKSHHFFNHKLSSFIEIGVGVSGGGRVDSGQGLFIKPMIGINYHVNNDFAVNIAGGKMVSLDGNVDSFNVNLGLTYGFSILSTKK